MAEGVDAAGEDGARALYFDLVTRTFPPLANGELQEVHWVDAAVAICIGFEKGSIPASPDDGLDTRKLRRVSRAAAGNALKSELTAALKTLLDAGHMTIVSVAVETKATGLIAGELKYFNNRLSPAPTQPTTLNLA